MKGRLLIGVVSHVLAVLAGIGVAAWSGSARDESGGGKAGQPRGLTVDAGRGEGPRRALAASDLPVTWEEIARTSMSAIERSALKRRLIEEWMGRDPLGLLEFAEGRNLWPQPLRQFGGSLCSSELGRLAPGRFFEFLRREGYQDAMFRGLGDCDSGLLGEMLQRLPPGERGAVWSQIMANHAEAAREERVVDLCREGEYEALAAAWAGVKEEDVRERIGDSIAKGFFLERVDEELVTELLRLPKDLGEAVLKDLLWDPVWDHEATWMAFREARDRRRRVAEQIARAGMPTAAEVSLNGMALGNWEPPFDQLQVAGENIEWVSGLPEDPCYDCLRSRVFTDWSVLDRDAAVAAIGEMPAGRIRDAIASSVADDAHHHTRGREDREKKAAQIRVLVGLITDPELRGKMEKMIDPGDPWGRETDPFAPDDDPFAQ
jgi:hypothetical protein